MKKRRIAALIAICTAVGCAESGYGTFQGDVVGGPDCMSDFMPFDSEFQTAQSQDSSIVLLFQSDGGNPSGKDLLAFVMREPSEFSTGTTYSLESPMSSTGFSGELSLRHSCPQQPLSLALTGDITVTQFDDVSDSIVSGTLANGTVVDARSGETLISNLTGSWEFPYETGPPYEPFP